MKQPYFEAFIKQAMIKLLSSSKRTLREIALKLNVAHHTTKNCIQRGSADMVDMSPGKEKRPQDWCA